MTNHPSVWQVWKDHWQLILLGTLPGAICGGIAGLLLHWIANG